MNSLKRTGKGIAISASIFILGLLVPGVAKIEIGITIVAGLGILLGGIAVGRSRDVVAISLLCGFSGFFLGGILAWGTRDLPYWLSGSMGFVLGLVAMAVSCIIGWFCAADSANLEKPRRNRNGRGLSIIPIIVLLGCPTLGLAFEFEKGDGLLRDLAYGIDQYELPFVDWVGHAGMYRELVGPPPVDPLDQAILEMSGFGLERGRTMWSWEQEVGEDDIWGVKSMVDLTATQRRELINVVNSFTNTQYGAFSTYKSPNSSPPTFRCDGLVEYAYETVLGEEWRPANESPFFNGGIIRNDVWGPPALVFPGDQDVLTPNAMWHSTRWATRTSGVDPVIGLRDSSDNVIPDGGVTSDTDVSVIATDGQWGSGLTLLEVWHGNPDSGGVKLKSFPENYDEFHTYTASEIGSLPEGEIFVRAYDQAGNDISVGFNIADPLFLVGGRKLIFSESAIENAENQGRRGFYHRADFAIFCPRHAEETWS